MLFDVTVKDAIEDRIVRGETEGSIKSESIPDQTLEKALTIEALKKLTTPTHEHIEKVK